MDGPAAGLKTYARGVPETFLLIDGENIDATLGAGVLGRRPAPEERPRWDRVRDYAPRRLGPAGARPVLPQRLRAPCRWRSSRR